MKHIVAVNASPRAGWNTATLIREAARGAEAEGARVEVFDLYQLEKFTGCVSCFGCKLPAHRGRCVCRDGLAPVLESIRRADGLILGSPNYLGDVTAGFRALYERLIFQYITYNREAPSCSDRSIPVLLIMTSNAPEAMYTPDGYGRVLASYRNTLSGFVGPTRVLVSADTLQVNDYGRYDWTMFDPEAKRARHETVFPQEKQRAFELGAEMVQNPWRTMD